MKPGRILLVFAVSLLLAACSSMTPSTIVQQPMTARPQPRENIVTTQGAIYSPSNTRPLFEDRRARYIGDIITINIVENTAASKDSETQASHSNTMTAGAPSITGLLPFGKLVGDISANASSSSAFDGKGSNTSSNTFNSTITCTVVDVLSNGNLVVSGEKELGLKQGEEFVRFSGVVNPTTITTSNTVQSTQVADARIEFKANGFIDSAQTMGWLSRFFLSVLPF